MNRLTLGIIVALTLACAVLAGKCTNLQDQATSYEGLYRLQTQKSKVWKTESGKWRNKAEAASVSSGTLKDLVNNNNAEFKNLHKRFEGLNKKLNNLSSAVTTSSVTNTTFNARLTDTVYVNIVNRDTVRMPAKKFEWADTSGFNKFNGIIVDDKITGSFESIDSLETVTYWERKWALGKKRYFTEIESKNPNTKVVYNKSVVVKPRRRRRFFGIF